LGKEVVSKEHYIFDIVDEKDSYELARKNTTVYKGSLTNG
jgi:hypothetical protein